MKTRSIIILAWLINILLMVGIYVQHTANSTRDVIRWLAFSILIHLIAIGIDWYRKERGIE